MNGVSADVRCGDAGRGGDRWLNAARAQICDVRMYCVCLAPPRLARQKHVRAGFQNRECFRLLHQNILPPILACKNKRGACASYICFFRAFTAAMMIMTSETRK